jgi:hypothetical protein
MHKQLLDLNLLLKYYSLTIRFLRAISKALGKLSNARALMVLHEGMSETSLRRRKSIKQQEKK